MSEQKEYIPLQNAFITQNSDKKGKTAWMVKQNATMEPLGELPKNLTESQVFDIMAFARKYELEAFNVGIQFGKGKQREIDKQIIAELQAKIQAVLHENARLADTLDRVTKKEPFNLN